VPERRAQERCQQWLRGIALECLRALGPAAAQSVPTVMRMRCLIEHFEGSSGADVSKAQGGAQWSRLKAALGDSMGEEGSARYMPVLRLPPLRRVVCAAAAHWNGSMTKGQLLEYARTSPLLAGHQEDAWAERLVTVMRQEMYEAEVSSTGKRFWRLKEAPSNDEFAEARKHVKYCSWGQRYTFEFVDRDGKRIPFQCTVGMAGNDQAATEQIALRCYARFQDGASKAEVLRFRSELFRQRLGAAAAPGRPAKRQRTAEAREGRG